MIGTNVNWSGIVHSQEIQVVFFDVAFPCILNELLFAFLKWLSTFLCWFAERRSCCYQTSTTRTIACRCRWGGFINWRWRRASYRWWTWLSSLWLWCIANMALQNVCNCVIHILCFLWKNFLYMHFVFITFFRVNYKLLLYFLELYPKNVFLI